MELSDGINIHIPGRFALGKLASPQAELRRLASLLAQGIESLGGLYMRMCDLIRDAGLTDSQVREALSETFNGPRISELLRVAHSPEEVYVRYRAGFFGFKAALRECRGYSVTPVDELRRRKLRRAAERLIELCGGAADLHVRGHAVRVSPDHQSSI